MISILFLNCKLFKYIPDRINISEIKITHFIIIILIKYIDLDKINEQNFL